MDCSITRRDEGGYATAAAAVICAAIALVVTAVVARSFAELRLSRADLARESAEYALSAAQNGAVLAIASSTAPPPYHWTLASLGQGVDVVAEPEFAKLSLAAAQALDDDALQRLGASDPARARQALAHSASTVAGGGLAWIEDADADAGALWRSCAASYVSQFGTATAPAPLVYNAPEAGKTAAFWRAGEVWRIEVTEPDGWRDERVVRFTGNALKPAAIIGRRLSRTRKGAQCENLLDASSGA